jgi:hypothetical protein
MVLGVVFGAQLSGEDGRVEGEDPRRQVHVEHVHDENPPSSQQCLVGMKCQGNPNGLARSDIGDSDGE